MAECQRNADPHLAHELSILYSTLHNVLSVDDG